ncbi:hypothetical protein NL676_025013 [Syzygium grande]|nr:hypothetical protein NL676_025013 [Syzygium grande]
MHHPYQKKGSPCVEVIVTEGESGLDANALHYSSFGSITQYAWSPSIHLQPGQHRFNTRGTKGPKLSIQNGVPVTGYVPLRNCFKQLLGTHCKAAIEARSFSNQG